MMHHMCLTIRLAPSSISQQAHLRRTMTCTSGDYPCLTCFHESRPFSVLLHSSGCRDCQLDFLLATMCMTSANRTFWMCAGCSGMIWSGHCGRACSTLRRLAGSIGQLGRPEDD